MGYALPAAFGAKVGDPSREVVAIIGDGCFQMTLQELGTIAQSGLPVKAIILNNNFLGMVRQWQQLFFEKRYSFVELQNPDFITIAKGFGIAGHTCDHRENLSDSLDLSLIHISIALVKDGDKITIDANTRQLTLHISDEEMATRKSQWVQPEPRFTKGVLGKYIRSVKSASEGCVTDEV